MPSTREHLMDQLASYSALGRACAVRGCSKVVENFHPYCRNHRQREASVGSATASIISGKVVKYWREKLVWPWLDLQAGHFGIVNAMEACDLWINSGQLAYNYGPHLTTNQRVQHWAGKIKAQGAEGGDVLATMMAIHALRWWQPRDFPPRKQDRYFRLQIANKVMALAMRGFGAKGQKVRVRGDRCPAQETIAVRELLYANLDRKVGHLCRRAAPEIVRLHPEYHWHRQDVEGSDVPFRSPSDD